MVMNNLDGEEIMSLTEGAVYAHRKFGIRKPSATTMARWCLSGMRGRRLESIKAGGPRRTSREAINRFFQRLAEPTVRRVNSNAAREATEFLIAEGV
jgi:hypothetical protein